VTEPGTKADPARDEIKVDGRRVKAPAGRRYILLYKPRGYITTRADPQRRPTVIDLLTRGGVREYVYPVGRLDYDSEGLLLLTSDGDLAAKLTHPRHGVEREYHVRVRGVPEERQLERLARGILVEGRRTAPATITLQKVIDADSGPQAVLAIVIREGRNRQVRNMCDAIGHPVVRLRRVRIGPITDDRIRPGEFRDLEAREVTALKRLAGAGEGAGVAQPTGKAHTEARRQGERTGKTQTEARRQGERTGKAHTEAPRHEGRARPATRGGSRAGAAGGTGRVRPARTRPRR
jgi:pseudouridine synthase